MNTINDHCINVCNSLLRGELSAAETYAQAIETHAGSPAIEHLRAIRAEHENSASLLSANVREMGGEPGKDSGAWGIFAVTVQGAADLLGENSALASLKKGEEIGRDDYQKALNDEDVMAECKRLIAEELLPSVNSHIAILETLEQGL